MRGSNLDSLDLHFDLKILGSNFKSINLKKIEDHYRPVPKQKARGAIKTT